MISTYVVYIRPNQSGNACFVFFFSTSCYTIHPALHSVLDVRLWGGNLHFLVQSTYFHICCQQESNQKTRLKWAKCCMLMLHCNLWGFWCNEASLAVFNVNTLINSAEVGGIIFMCCCCCLKTNWLVSATFSSLGWATYVMCVSVHLSCQWW